MKKYKNKNAKGFSILEAIVALYIISMGLVGILSLVAQSLQAKSININMLIASQLAQEGLELVRNIRDTNWMNGINWDQGIVGDFAIDYLGNNIAVTGIDDPFANLELDSDYYCHDNGAVACNGADSPFNRLVSVNQILINGGPDYYLDVACHVRWQVRGQAYNYEADTHLYDW